MERDLWNGSIESVLGRTVDHMPEPHPEGVPEEAVLGLLQNIKDRLGRSVEAVEDLAHREKDIRLHPESHTSAEVTAAEHYYYRHDGKVDGFIVARHYIDDTMDMVRHHQWPTAS